MHGSLQSVVWLFKGETFARFYEVALSIYPIAKQLATFESGV